MHPIADSNNAYQLTASRTDVVVELRGSDVSCNAFRSERTQKTFCT